MIVVREPNHFLLQTWSFLEEFLLLELEAVLVLLEGLGSSSVGL